jgi:hypothetical protein
MAETLRSYLVKIGFDIDSSSQARFESVMIKTTAMAIGLEHAIQGLAQKAVSSFTDMTASYEKLYFLSQKLGQSAASIKSFQFAAEQNGASAAEATALVEKLISYRRQYGAGSGNDVIGSWFRIDPKSPTMLKDISKSLLGMSQQQSSAIQRAVGGSDNLLDAMRNPKFAEYFKEEAERIAAINGTMTDRIAKGALAFNNAWRGIQATIGEVAVSIFASVTGERGPVEAMRAFDKWMLDNAPQILKAFSNIAVKVIDFAEAFVSVVSGVDSADPKIRAIADAFGSWGVTLDKLVTGLQTLAAILAGGVVFQFFAMLAGVLGVATGGGAVVALAGIAAAMGAAYLTYSKIGEMLPAGGAGKGAGGIGGAEAAPAPAPSSDGRAPAPGQQAAPAPAESGKVGIGGGQPQAPAYGPGSGVDIAGPAGAADYKGAYTGPGANLRNKGGAALNDRYRLSMSVAMDELRKQGVPEANLRAAAAIMVGNASAESELIPQTRHEAGGTGYGIYGADPTRQRQMFKWMAENGYNKDSLAGQTRYMAIESRKRGGAPWRALMGATLGNLASGNWTYTAGFEVPAVVNNRMAQTAAAYRAGAGGTPPPSGPPQLKDNMTTAEINAWNAAHGGGPQPAGGQVSPGFTKPSSLYGSPQIQAMLRKYGMGGDISSKYKSATGFENAPITAALTEAGGWAEKANAVMAALKLDARLGVKGLKQDFYDIAAFGHKLKDTIRKGLGGPGVRAKDALKNTPLSDHAGHAFAADHLKTTPMGAGHTHLMNHSNVHAPSQHNNITIHGVTDPETAMRDLGWHQKRLWSGLTRNTTTSAN